MDIHIKSLTEAGLIKISLPSSYASKGKIRLYRFSDQTPEGMAKIQTIFELEMKGRIYKGFVSAMFQEISNRPYLFKEGSHFKLISREDALSVGYSRAGYIHYKSGEYHKAIPWYERDLKFALEFKHKLGEGRAYCNLGNAYDSLGDARKAINFHKKHLKSTLELEDKSGEGIAYGNIGNAYRSLGKIHQAINFYKKSLKIALELQDKGGEGLAYGNLGNACSSLGETRKAIDFHEKRLKIVLELQDEEGEGASYCNLGNAYGSLGEIRKAIDFHDKHLKIALKLQDKGGEGRAYGHLGNAYRSLGEIHQAINFHEKALKIALELQDKVREGRAYVNLGNAYDSLREHSRAIDFYNKSLKSALELQDKNWEGVTYGNLGNAHDSLGETRKAIAFHKKALKIALELQDRGGEKRAYCNLGNAYYFLGEIRKAIDFYNKSLKIALELQDKGLEGGAYCNLGSAYDSLEECSQAEKYFRQSIKIFASLQQDAKRAQWQISIFEELSKPYVGLEQVLFKIGDIRALEISDTRRARALSSLLFERLNLKENQDFHLNLLSVQDMQDLAERLDTTFIIYSLNIVNNKVMSVHAWVVSCDQQPIQSFSLSISEDAFSELDHIFKTFPYQIEKTRPVKGAKQPSQFFEERLSSWYDLFIAPLEEHIPLPGSGKTLTFIPDGFLAHLPFGAFYNRKKDQYLIENYPITVAPSIQVLSLLDQLPKEPLNEALLMGNPKTPQEAYNNLKKSEAEVRDIIARLMQNIDVKVLTQEEATVGNVFTHAPHARVIHIAGHGVANQKPLDDPYSVFEGLFRLAPDHKYLAGDLHAKDVHLLKLKADLVFMSACHLGRGNLKQEGSIGPVWSFLGSGAKSTIASYWPLPEGDMTLKMVDTFYRHYLGIDTPRLSKARALQESVLMAMKTERNKPRQWGAFFLAGLID
ncbi:tetratricopeptide repeat protein [Rhabdochlamydiaceae symbiont of Dictyostelium giganteum]|uniref:CHAT domain-containing tetratricopeptide repeat protein n=1 Tax=Rhabdochlamydiaceae symbiont of Dictyostelium giganteum TaxID=3342349 RepID=UPI00384C8FD8